jgi:putative transposase
VLKRLGLVRGLYYRWRQRQAQGQLADQKASPVDLYQALPEEEAAVKQFALEHPRDGYRRLAWMMVDHNVAYLSPSSVYRILDRYQLLCRWKPSRPVGQKPTPPTRPHQVWHTDLMYLWIGGRWYFFMAVLDGFSRFILHWDLLASMRSAEVVDVIHAALEKYPEKPRLVHDNGPQFTGKEFRELIKRFTLEEIRIRVYHPESNGKIERFHGLLRQEGLSDQELRHQLHAQEIIGRWVEHYNQERLHASLSYLTPQDWFLQRQQTRLAERKQKLAAAQKHRYQENLKRRQKKLDCQRPVGGVAPKPLGFSALTDPVHLGTGSGAVFEAPG